ncbi:HSP20 family molecular chaperone IbpA [Actinomycetospora succinea]|uniref:HSP20 family molecular chaperone IbpA n=1 Tax=Actinomycetospora succinea TaxID=663603 RepID=A0A4R6VK04_9PSEU|nr:Hsp20/alpha crystallin family protein [Actinomycetospora succinea]TDQ63176.1 HSP20 family molecular chaperone IbpA [Actinomycetospora succinea]
MSTLVPWGPRFADPFAVADALFRRPAPSRPQAFYAPTTDVVRDGDDAVVRLELPGVDVAKDVTVDVDGHRLTVRGERRDEQSGEGWRESRRGSFRRSFTLPQHVDADAVSASYDAGVLTLRVVGAHAEPVEPGAQRIAIDGIAPPEESAASSDATPEAGEASEDRAA